MAITKAVIAFAEMATAIPTTNQKIMLFVFSIFRGSPPAVKKKMPAIIPIIIAKDKASQNTISVKV